MLCAVSTQDPRDGKNDCLCSFYAERVPNELIQIQSYSNRQPIAFKWFGLCLDEEKKFLKNEMRQIKKRNRKEKSKNTFWYILIELICGIQVTGIGLLQIEFLWRRKMKFKRKNPRNSPTSGLRVLIWYWELCYPPLFMDSGYRRGKKISFY